MADHAITRQANVFVQPVTIRQTVRAPVVYKFAILQDRMLIAIAKEIVFVSQDLLVVNVNACLVSKPV